MEPKPQKLTEITFNLIVDSSPNAVLLVNQEGRIAYINRQCETLFGGYAATELIGKSIEMLIPERFREHHAALRSSYSRAPTMRSMGAGLDLYGLRKDGVEFPIEIGLNPMVLVDGTWILATVIDITERKHAEARFRQVVDSAPNAMILVNKTGVITLVNQQALTLFGYAESEMIGQSVDMLLPEQYRRGHEAKRNAFFADPQTRSMGAGRDLCGRRKDGSEFPIEIGLNPMQTEDGLVALASIIDITTRRMNEELRAKKEVAEAAYKAKGELLAIASHDLKNPLAAIAGLADLLLEMKKTDGSASTQDVEFLQSIHDAASHMSKVVRGILESEGMEQQGLTFDEEKVDLSALCVELVRLCENTAQRKGIRLTSAIEPNVALRGNATRLREAFDNYISNAIKYSPAEKTVTVTLKKMPDGKQVEFGVQDQGPGLSDDDKTKLFGKFKKLSAKPTGGESSTGLGLSIVKTIIELHHGTVGCESQLGKGAYFWARLPLNA